MTRQSFPVAVKNDGFVQGAQARIFATVFLPLVANRSSPEGPAGMARRWEGDAAGPGPWLDRLGPY